MSIRVLHSMEPDPKAGVGAHLPTEDVVVKINTRIRYAVRLMADIAKHGTEGRPVPLGDVARRQDISKQYLAQLAISLRRVKLLRSVLGNRGGYVLGPAASEITLLQIIEAVEGPVGVLNCVLEPEVCDRAGFCESIDIWRDINETIRSGFTKYRLSDLTEQTAPAGWTGLTPVLPALSHGG